MYKEDKLIGFGRVATDYAIFAYIMDVFVVPEHRNKGCSKQLIEVIVNAEELKKCKTWMLKTFDVHGLYQQFGFFTALKNPDISEKALLNCFKV